MTQHLDHHNPIPPTTPPEPQYFGDVAFGTRRFGRLTPGEGLQALIDPHEADSIEWGTRNNRAVKLAKLWLEDALGAEVPEEMVKEFTEEVTSRLNGSMFVLSVSWVRIWAGTWDYWKRREMEQDGGV